MGVEECRLIHEIKRGTVTTANVIASLSLDERPVPGTPRACKGVFFFTPATAKLNREHFDKFRAFQKSAFGSPVLSTYSLYGSRSQSPFLC
jgi:hypothetical protein